MGKVFPLTIIASIFLLLTAKIFSMPVPPNHPLCISQFALANQACSMLPFTSDVPVKSGEATVFTLGTPIDPQEDDEGEEGDEDNEQDDDDDDNEDIPQTGPGPHDRHESDRDDDGSNGSPSGGSSGSGSPSGGSGNSSRNGGRRGHGRRHRHSSKDNGHKRGRRHSHHHEKPETSECCKWLKEVDASCVCDLLVRLPVFLRRPTHSIVVKVDHACDVTYACLGRLLQ